MCTFRNCIRCRVDVFTSLCMLGEEALLIGLEATWRVSVLFVRFSRLLTACLFILLASLLDNWLLWRSLSFFSFHLILVSILSNKITSQCWPCNQLIRGLSLLLGFFLGGGNSPLLHFSTVLSTAFHRILKPSHLLALRIFFTRWKFL